VLKIIEPTQEKALDIQATNKQSKTNEIYFIKFVVMVK
jgi:hypothetical protein